MHHMEPATQHDLQHTFQPPFQPLPISLLSSVAPCPPHLEQRAASGGVCGARLHPLQTSAPRAAGCIRVRGLFGGQVEVGRRVGQLLRPSRAAWHCLRNTAGSGCATLPTVNPRRSQRHASPGPLDPTHHLAAGTGRAWQHRRRRHPHRRPWVAARCHGPLPRSVGRAPRSPPPSHLHRQMQGSRSSMQEAVSQGSCM